MAEELRDPTEPQRVAQAVLGVMAAVAHREARVPGMGEGRAGYDLPSLGQALNEIADTELLSGSAKAQVFSAVLLAHGRTPELERVAASLLKPELRVSSAANGIVAEIFAMTEEQPLNSGQDLFHREPRDLLTPTPIMDKLSDDLSDFLVEFEPVDCGASVVSIENTLALSIETRAYTRRPLASLVDIIDPLNWPNCALQHLFFQSMTTVGGLSDLAVPDESQPPTPQPLNNWRGTLAREVVDWSLGGGWLPFTTDLDFVFFQGGGASGAPTTSARPSTTR